MDTVMVYYIGHGVEHNNNTHAVLREGDCRYKYNLENMVSRIGKYRLVHCMFDCNRIYMNHLLPTKAKAYQKNTNYCFSYTALAGRETKSLNSVQTYIDHLR